MKPVMLCRKQNTCDRAPECDHAEEHYWDHYCRQCGCCHYVRTDLMPGEKDEYLEDIKRKPSTESYLH